MTKTMLLIFLYDSKLKTNESTCSGQSNINEEHKRMMPCNPQAQIYS